jgi:hypothetical protein
MAAAIKRSSDRTIRNVLRLTAGKVVGKRVVCPLCEDKVFAKWPVGWDAHAAHKCKGVSGATQNKRKTEFKRRVRHLFR